MKTREKYSALGFADKKRKIYAPVACIVSSVQLGNSASDLLLFCTEQVRLGCEINKEETQKVLIINMMPRDTDYSRVKFK